MIAIARRAEVAEATEWHEVQRLGKSGWEVLYPRVPAAELAPMIAALAPGHRHRILKVVQTVIDDFTVPRCCEEHAA